MCFTFFFSFIKTLPAVAPLSQRRNKVRSIPFEFLIQSDESQLCKCSVITLVWQFKNWFGLQIFSLLFCIKMITTAAGEIFFHTQGAKNEEVSNRNTPPLFSRSLDQPRSKTSKLEN